MGKVYPNRASFLQYLPSISADENTQGPMRAEARGILQGSRCLPSMQWRGQETRAQDLPVGHGMAWHGRRAGGGALFSSCHKIWP